MAFVNTWAAGIVTALDQVIAPISPNGFVYKATVAGTTGTQEPAWPLTAGLTVVDGTVTWQAVTATAITWQAEPIYESSGSVVVLWPTTPGATVVDGTITWQCVAPNVQDAKCPNTKEVIIAASKVFAIKNDGNVVRYSATNNPNDWSTAGDAGFLPTGLQAQVDPRARALGLYRGNLVVMSSGELQLWQVDPDPAQMALLDNIPSIGTIYSKASASAAGELYFLTEQGVRSISIAAGSTNLQAGDVGTPIDLLIQAELPGSDPLGLYYPGGGQYWLVFGANVYVYSQSRIGGIGAWSLYEFPDAIEYTTQLDGKLYVRSGDVVYMIDEETGQDDGDPVPGTVQWPWLDFGQVGVQKMLIGVDLVASGDPQVSIGYDERNPAAFTTPFTIPSDTQVGGIIPIPISAPSMSIRYDFAGDAGRWELQATTVYLSDMRATA